MLASVQDTGVPSVSRSDSEVSGVLSHIGWLKCLFFEMHPYHSVSYRAERQACDQNLVHEAARNQNNPTVLLCVACAVNTRLFLASYHPRGTVPTCQDFPSRYFPTIFSLPNDTAFQG